jgi:predicted glycoside hydrolase/deacetylase ChbG (UPF0249 family)
LKRRLIINADDYGLTPGISQGILDAHLKGVVTSTTVLVGSPYAADAIRLALQSAPRLGLGLHLALSGTGRPVLPPSEIPSLVQEDGSFYPLEDWLARISEFNAADIIHELRAQVERFIQITGQPPDHLDGHHHAVYRHPVALNELCDLALDYEIPIRNVWSDKPVDAAIHRLLEGTSIEWRATKAQDIEDILTMKEPMPHWPERFEDTFYDATSTLGDLLLILTSLPEGVTEIMCHPGYADAALDSDYTTRRNEEVKTLTHNSVREVLKAESIDLINFGGLRRLQGAPQPGSTDE